MRVPTVIFLLAPLLVAACAASGPFTTRNGILASPNGHTLYMYAKDPPGKSTCYGTCASRWPPYLVAQGAPTPEMYTVITRDDGTRQWSYNGQAVYFNATDYLPGDRKGGGVDGVWSVVRMPMLSAPEATRGSDGGY